ncbi:MAG: hypothetical protein DRJ01_19085, partial [Bacteroidetes bacterium]
SEEINFLEDLVKKFSFGISHIRNKKKQEKIEESLRISEDKFRKLTEISNDVIWTIDLNYKYTYISPSIKEKRGYTQEEFLNLPLEKIYSQESLKKIKEAFPREMEKAKEGKIDKNYFYVMELEHLHKDGSTSWGEVNINPIWDKNDKIIGIHGITRDITKRKMIEKELKESEKTLRTIFDGISDSIYMIDKDFQIVKPNKAFIKFVNCSKEEALGKHCYQLFMGKERICRNCIAKEVLKSKKSLTVERTYTFQKGNIQYFEISAFPINDDLGDISHIVILIRDITSERKAREDLYLTRFFVESANVAILWFDSKSNIIYANQAECDALGYSCDELRKMTIPDIVPEFPRDKWYEYWLNIKQKSYDTFETYHKRKNGTIFPVTTSVHHLIFNKKEYNFVISFDITKRKQSEKIQKILYDISNAVITTKNLEELFPIIRDTLGKIIDTKNFYVALYNKKEDILSLQYMIDEKDNFKSFPAGQGLTAYIIKTGKALFLTNDGIEKMQKAGLIKRVGSKAKVWLGVPLKTKSGVIGVLVIQNYEDENAINKNDMQVLEFVSNQIGLSIERKIAEEKIKRNLLEKNILLKEIHHRVKNNMQVISSMLKLQSSYIKDKIDKELFNDSQNRVRTMSLIHEKLYMAPDLANINFREYVVSLATFLFSSYGINPTRVILNVNIKDVYLDVNMAIPCGLLINEIISNSLKYAFPDNNEGNIAVQMWLSKDEKYHLIIKDNGIGLPDDFNLENLDSLGVRLVNALVDQLHGEIKIKRENGTSYEIIFTKLLLKSYHEE